MSDWSGVCTFGKSVLTPSVLTRASSFACGSSCSCSVAIGRLPWARSVSSVLRVPVLFLYPDHRRTFLGGFARLLPGFHGGPDQVPLRRERRSGQRLARVEDG